MPTIGLISDTHNLLRPEAIAALRGSDYLIHAGDICNGEIIAALAEIAPLTVVRGNNDRGPWAQGIAEDAVMHVDGIAIYVIHDLATLRLDPTTAGIQVVVSGHSHQPLISQRDGVLFVNPGSAGPRRFRLPISVGRLQINDGKVAAELITLNIPPASAHQ